MGSTGAPERDAGRRRASLLAAVACAGLAVWLWLDQGRATWSLPVAAVWFAWRGLRRPTGSTPRKTTRN